MKVILLERVETPWRPRRRGHRKGRLRTQLPFAEIQGSARHRSQSEGVRRPAAEIEARNARERESASGIGREARRRVLCADPPGWRRRPSLWLGVRPRRGRGGQRRGREDRPVEGGARQAPQEPSASHAVKGQASCRGRGHDQHQYRPQSRRGERVRRAGEQTSSVSQSRKTPNHAESQADMLRSGRGQASRGPGLRPGSICPQATRNL